MNRLWVRLSLAFTVVVLLGVFAVGAIGFLITDTNVRKQLLVREAQDPGGLIDTLESHYRSQHSWQGVDRLLDGALAAMPFRPWGGLVFIVTDDTGRVVENTGWSRQGEMLSPEQLREALAIQVDGATVGYLAIQPGPRAPRPPGMYPAHSNFLRGRNSEQPGEPIPPPPLDWTETGQEPPLPRAFFLQSISRTMIWAAILFGILGMLFGVVMSRNLTAPLRRLAEAAQAIGQQDFSKRVEVTGTEEIREVARAFNAMVAELDQAETLRRNLLADVSHELRTPLSVLQGNLRAILDEVYPLEQSEIARLYDQTRLLGRLVEDLHELARAEARQLPLNIQSVDVSELVQQVITTFAPAAEAASVSLQTNAPAELPKIQVDPARITQVLNNLLSNALRHTPPGGTIIIAGEAGGYGVRLKVRDSGEGIAAEDLPRVFDRFYRADPARNRATGGAGLGLAIARAIVEMHGGRIWAESDGVPGQGSLFTVELPGERPA